MDDARLTMTFVVTIMYLFYKKAIKEQAYISNTTKIYFEICMSSFMLQKLYNKWTDASKQDQPSVNEKHDLKQYLWIVLVLYELLSGNLPPEVWNPLT